MPVVAVIPVKSFRLGKGRMADEISPSLRHRLGEEFAERTVHTAETAGLIPVVVAGDPAVAEWALLRGIPTIADRGVGLDEAAAEGTTWAGVAGSAWLVVHSDLPLLTPRDLEQAVTSIEAGHTVLAPSSDGGTSLFGGEGKVRFQYGPGSFTRHLGQRPESDIIVSLGSLHDVDSVDDLRSARNHPLGAWMADLVR